MMFKIISARFASFGIKFDRKWDGFILEELEYKADDEKKSLKEMQEEFLKRNKSTTLDADGVELTDIERMSKGNRSQHNKELDYEAIYDGITLYDENNTLLTIRYEKKIYGNYRLKGNSY